ncbi:zinc carboxypeptidase [Flagelloscypha sp. PMI_526]|nr:zinc carboxypeptidase [Flagelloscypha sp. PMI_526]
MRLLSVAIVALATFASAFTVSRDAPEVTPVSYDGLRFLRITPSSEADVFKLKTLVSEWDLTVLTEHGDKMEEFDAQISSYEVIHEDLGAAIAEERAGFAPSLTEGRLAPAAIDPSTWWTAYHAYADHMTFVSDLHALYPNNSEVVTAGTSYEGKTITGIHFWGSGGKGSKSAIIFHGTIHAREWIATPTVEYIAYQLLSGYANDTSIKAIVDAYDFYIFPVTNPDGFSYSQTTERLWRKNRNPPPSGSSCYGIDLNRNWNIHWSDTGGASTSPCAEDYKGTAVASTSEIKGLQAFSQALIAGKGITLYIDFHSYGQLFLFPYGYDCTTNPDSSYYETLGGVFKTAVKASRGTTYTVEQSCTLYTTTGASDDYHYGTLGVWDAYTVELPSTTSFVLPATSILPVAKESWAGVLAMLKKGGFGG